MNANIFGASTFAVGMIMIAWAAVANVHAAPLRVQCQEDEIVMSSNGRDHDTCRNIDEFGADWIAEICPSSAVYFGGTCTAVQDITTNIDPDGFRYWAIEVGADPAPNLR